jgi:hypothetical protein
LNYWLEWDTFVLCFASRDSRHLHHLCNYDAAFPPIELAATLLSAPIELAGDWGHMIPRSADQVVERMRHSCLDGVRLLSDRQPTRLRVDEHASGSPAVWLHPDGSSMAWIIVDIGQQAWATLAYQFGHELGQDCPAMPWG